MNNNSTEKEQRNKYLLYLLGTLLIIGGILLITFLLHGDTTVTKNEDNTETVQSLTCKGNGIIYPFFSYDNAKDKSLKINAVFYNDELNEISFVYRLSYDNNTQAKESEARNHADLGISFGKDSLGVDAFNANFSILENVMQLSLYAKASSIGSVESKYFLVENTNGIYKIDNITKSYTNKGLDCVSKQ